MNGKVAGLILLALIIVGGLFMFQQAGGGKPQVILKGYVGGEKMNLLHNEKVKNILKRKYGITLNSIKAGSIEMVQEKHGKDVDFLWPSSQVALQLFKMQKGHLLKSEIIFNSPIVFYSWDAVARALIKAGIVAVRDKVYYIVNCQKLFNLIVTGKKWKDIGLDELYGKIVLRCTHPAKSNSGNMFSGLLANILNKGEVVDEQTIQPLLPQIKTYFKRLGYMPHSSSILFEDYIKKGMGAMPLVAGYENQIIEFSRMHKDVWPKIKVRMRIMYPEPTVWSSHPVIILSKRAKALIEALKDKGIQQIAWEEHGFRTGMLGVTNDPRLLQIVGIPSEIKKVIPMPNPVVMDTIIKTVGSH